MWQETLIETRRAAGNRSKWLTFPVAVAMHAVVVVGFSVASFWKVEAMELPSAGSISAFTVESLPGGTPPPKGVQRVQRQETLKQTKKQKTKEQIIPQRTATQDVIPEDYSNLESLEPDIPESNAPFGYEFGVPGGDPGSGTDEFGTGGGESIPEVDRIEIIRPGVESPVLLVRIEPEYPEVARRARIQGIVILEAVISTGGTVENARVLRSAHPLLDQSAIRGVLQWRYRPATINGKPVRVYFTVTVSYKLQRGG